ncbi:IS1380 family transposase [Dactylosporangium sp. CA-152071]|uniref:IS1380 family transposase n=1 Tax=Dactylosporangium sp. CA-152071 TaxID=3239933 RepID=UPI003D91A9D5
MQGSHAFRADGAVFDEGNLVSHAGLVPLLELAEQAGLSQLLDQHVRFVDERVRSGAANPTPKLTSIIAGMAAGADSIDDLDVIRAGGMRQLFGGVYASTTLGIFLREFTHGHTRQLSTVLRRHLVALTQRTPVLHDIAEQAFIDIDSLLRPVYGHAKQGASFGHTKIAGKTILRRGLSPLAATICTRTTAPVIAAVRLRAGRAASAKGAASILTEAINTAVAAGAQPGNLLIRGDSAYGNGKVITAVRNAGARFSFTLTKTSTVNAAIAAIDDEQYTPVHYPGAVTDPDTGALISDAQVAEITFTAFADSHHRVTARLIVRRVLDANTQDPLFPVWRHHPFLTNNPEPTADADITHRRHAICETVWSDLIDGPWAHQPSGQFGANAAWTILAAICHNLLRAAGTLTRIPRYATARGATLRTHLINIPARLARPQRRPTLHLPTLWPRAHAWLALWKAVFT